MGKRKVRHKSAPAPTTTTCDPVADKGCVSDSECVAGSTRLSSVTPSSTNESTVTSLPTVEEVGNKQQNKAAAAAAATSSKGSAAVTSSSQPGSRPSSQPASMDPTRRSTRQRRPASRSPSAYSRSHTVAIKKTKLECSGKESLVAEVGDVRADKQAKAGASLPQQRRSPRKLNSKQKEADSQGNKPVAGDVKSAQAKPERAKDVIRTRTRKRKQAVDVTMTNGHGPGNEIPSAPVPIEKTAVAASKAAVSKTASVAMATSTQRARRKMATKRRGRGRGKGKKKTRRRQLPTFDEEDEYFDSLKNGCEPSKTEVQAEVNGLQPSTETDRCILHLNHSTEDSDMVDRDLNGTLGTSYDDMDLDSNQSSDDDLPDVLSQDSTKIHEGDVVWAKMRNFPFWPAVVKRLYKKKGKAAVFFAGELNKSNQKGKGVHLKSMKPYSCPEKEKLIEAGLKHPRVLKHEFQDAVDLTEDYITKRGLGKAQGASFFTTKDYSDVSPPPTAPLSITCTPSMRAGLPLEGAPTSPLTPPCDTPYKSLDSPVWKTGTPLGENQDQSIDTDEDSSDIDEELLEKRKNLTKLQERLMKYILKRPPAKEHLLKIFRGTVKSMRHKLYFTPGAEAHNRLKYMRGFGPITDDDKQDELLMFLRRVYEENCLKGDDDIVITSYLTDVWFPEVIIFALHKTHRIGHKRAEELFVSSEKNAMEVTGALDDVLPMYLTAQEKEELMENVTKRAARQLGFSPRELGLS